ncbi:MULTISPECIES: cupin domain-containing protein [unclassified Brevundimonas]|uniref:cupin domain-containing protein n=1 Tax=unclassified Brevundimonas TaxID=2622653 RepID=UPI0006F4BB85|nr:MULTISPECIES: cupin domain-containing protein [unclassified Brevundimonas]KQY73294.1 hypothetical protein ASD25_27400 [Brevundimonas sp. Root1423]KRA26426.1 hypothetical protein ASD59_08015 [Brevundimonas sp. Root608]
MLSLDELLHPITPARFRADYYGRKPLHIPAAEGGRKRDILTWDGWNALLGQPGIWTSQTLRPMRDHIPVRKDLYCDTVQTANGQVHRPSMPRLEIFLASGASLVANEVHHLHPPLTRLAAMLGEAFAAGVGCNVYYSSKGVRAFGTHYDNHEVFAIQTEGEKVWNIYEARADNPVDAMPDNMETRRWLEQTRGNLMQEVRMRPGDVLYIPRGCYHDALATTGPSLHATFGVNPLTGATIMSLLGLMAGKASLFRDWLPSAHTEDGALKDRLHELGDLLAHLAKSPLLAEEIGRLQRRQIERPREFALPQLQAMTLYRTTGRAFPDAGFDQRLAYDWATTAREFAAEEMAVQFDYLSEAEIRLALEAAEQAGAIQRV